jgi:hypothetical protein
MCDCWIAIEYNIDDDYWINPLGVFSTKEYAIEEVMKHINKTGFDDNESGSSNEEEVTAETLEQQLRKTGKCEHIFGYMVRKFTVDGKRD